MTQINPQLKRQYDTIMADPVSRMRQQMLAINHPILCKVDNNFAYHYCLGNKYKIFENSKCFNFVPTYDKWCLYCDDRSESTPKLKCSRCKSVFFCDTTCQRKAWKIHKKHCGQDLFKHCITCGKEILEEHQGKVWSKCDKCPVKFCSAKCHKELYASHQEFDCDYFAKTFQPLNSN